LFITALYLLYITNSLTVHVKVKLLVNSRRGQHGMQLIVTQSMCVYQSCNVQTPPSYMQITQSDTEVGAVLQAAQFTTRSQHANSTRCSKQ